MSGADSPEKSIVEPIGDRDGPLPAGRRRRFRGVPIRSLSLLVVLLVGYAIVMGIRTFSAAPPPPAGAERAPVTGAGATGTGLVSTRLRPADPQEPSPFRFTEVARESGIDFVHFSGMTAEKHSPTANASGVAIFDYDNDGKLDPYFATRTPL